jgi:formylglycine-generating enzyme required for sulfatase activity
MMRWMRGLALLGVTALVGPATASGESACPDPLRLVLVPAGAFKMGSDHRERGLARSLSGPAAIMADWFSQELSARTASTDAFCIDRVLVSHRDYAAFVRATKHAAPGISEEAYRRQGVVIHDYRETVTGYLWPRGMPPEDRLDHPVVLVSAGDAEAYCKWRFPDGLLPTEAEWEKASRGTDGQLFPWGSRWDPARANSAAGGPGSTTPVGHYASGASVYGMLDAVGNVFQWTSTALPDGRRVLKGCAWDEDPGLCRPAFRHARAPESRDIVIGFRCRTGADP